MFRFNFSNLDLEDDEFRSIDSNTGDVLYAPEQGQLSRPSEGTSSINAVKDNKYESDRHTSADGEYHEARELSLDELAQSLPPVFSYSPLVVPLSGEIASSSNASMNEIQHKSTSGNVTLLRRDLFDARYQLISEADANINEPPEGETGIVDRPEASTLEKKTSCHISEDALRFIDKPSDLVPGVYEGGLKTWECSLDLVDCLATLANVDDVRVDWIKGKRVIEVGCGTAIPSLFLLHSLFSHSQTVGSDAETSRTEFVLQDYNDLVLRLVTFPNVLLQWYASPLAEAYRSQHPPEDEPTFQPAAPGDLQITTELLNAFRTSLEEQRIAIRFIAGSWQSISQVDSLCAFPFDVTLTSETIYQTFSLPSLISLLMRSGRDGTNNLDEEIGKKTQNLSLEGGRRLCLVAAKVLYFGVGGGVMEFERAVVEAGGKVRIMLERKIGVGRKIMSIQWA